MTHSWHMCDTLQFPWQETFVFCLFYLILFSLRVGRGLARVGRGDVDTKGRGDEWDEGAQYEIHTKKSIKRLRKKEREKGRERKRERNRNRQRQKQKDRERHRGRDTQRETETERDREWESKRESKGVSRVVKSLGIAGLLSQISGIHINLEDKTDSTGCLSSNLPMSSMLSSCDNPHFLITPHFLSSQPCSAFLPLHRTTFPPFQKFPLVSIWVENIFPFLSLLFPFFFVFPFSLFWEHQVSL